MRVEITPEEILRAEHNLSLMELAAAKGFPITPILRQIDWTKVKQVKHYEDPCTKHHVI